MLITDHHPYVQIRILKQMVKSCLHHHIINPSFSRHSLQSYISINTSPSPVITNIKLILTGDLPYPDSQFVRLIHFQLIRHIKSKRSISAIMTPQFVPVEPNFSRWPYTTEMQQDTFVFPILRNCKLPHIKSLTGLIILESSINRFFISQQGPIGWNRSWLKFAFSKIRRIKPFQTVRLLLISGKCKLPCTA